MHRKDCEPIILSESEGLCIAQCRGCKQVGFMFNNLLVGFAPASFLTFIHDFGTLNFKAKCTPFPDGKPRIIIKTPQREIQFNFTEEEFEILKEAFHQASLMLTVSDILDHK